MLYFIMSAVDVVLFSIFSVPCTEGDSGMNVLYDVLMNSCLQSLVGHNGLPEPKVKLDLGGISKVLLPGYDGGSRVVLNEIESFSFVNMAPPPVCVCPIVVMFVIVAAVELLLLLLSNGFAVISSRCKTNCHASLSVCLSTKFLSLR